MTKGIRDLRQIQIAFQKDEDDAPACSRAVTPTARLVGTSGMKKTVNRVFPAEPTGLMSSHIIGRHYDPWLLCEVPITTGEEGLTYQQLPWFLAMAVTSGVSGDGVGTPKTWEFCPSLTAGDMPDLATLRYGDNAAVWQTTCAFARQLVISAAAQGSWEIEADIIGRDMKNTYLYKGYGLYGDYPVAYSPYYDMFFETIAYPTPLETILGQKTSLYVDLSCEFAATPTKKTGYLIDWRVTVPAFHPKFFQDGELYYTTMGLASRCLTFEATMEFDTVFTKHVLWDAWVAGTPVYARLLATGSVIDDPTTYTAQIDMVLDLESFETLEERDGNDIIKFTGRTVYDVACDVPEWCITVVNIDTDLP
jgi:hypothetical protein